MARLYYQPHLDSGMSHLVLIRHSVINPLAQSRNYSDRVAVDRLDLGRGPLNGGPAESGRSACRWRRSAWPWRQRPRASTAVATSGGCGGFLAIQLGLPRVDRYRPCIAGTLFPITVNLTVNHAQKRSSRLDDAILDSLSKRSVTLWSVRSALRGPSGTGRAQATEGRQTTGGGGCCEHRLNQTRRP
jgi:hypothetical protein